VLYFAGLSWRFLLTSAFSLAALAPVYWQFFMREYQKDRVLTFLNPEADPMGKGYHINLPPITMFLNLADGQLITSGLK
jgi:rod shape determining protein RodA